MKKDNRIAILTTVHMVAGAVEIVGVEEKKYGEKHKEAHLVR